MINVNIYMCIYIYIIYRYYYICEVKYISIDYGMYIPFFMFDLVYSIRCMHVTFNMCSIMI